MGRIRDVLRRSQLFSELSADELDEIVKLCQEETYEAGTTIFTEGQMASELYVVEDGRVVLEMTIRLGPGSGRQGAIDVVTKGQVFGWSAIAETHILTMSARCVEKTKVIFLDGSGLWRLLEKNSDLGYKVMKELVALVSSRLKHTRDNLAHVISIASHDLKAPLAAVESYHQVMLGGYAGEITEKQKTLLHRSSDRMTGLLNLIDNILDISRIDTRELKMESISLLKVLENTAGTARPLAQEKGVQLKVKAPKKLPLIVGAPNRLQQVFTNLLGNAIKFTREGGTVTLKVAEKQDGILVEVMDTGIGIRPEELPKIFDDFYRGIDADASGAGLGLAIAKKIVEAHGGKIWVESPCPATGTGSKFSLILPKSPAKIGGEKGGE